MTTLGVMYYYCSHFIDEEAGNGAVKNLLKSTILVGGGIFKFI